MTYPLHMYYKLCKQDFCSESSRMLMVDACAFLGLDMQLLTFVLFQVGQKLCEASLWPSILWFGANAIGLMRVFKSWMNNSTKSFPQITVHTDGPVIVRIKSISISERGSYESMSPDARDYTENHVEMFEKDSFICIYPCAFWDCIISFKVFAH